MLSGTSWEMLVGGQPAVCGTLVLTSTFVGDCGELTPSNVTGALHSLFIHLVSLGVTSISSPYQPPSRYLVGNPQTAKRPLCYVVLLYYVAADCVRAPHYKLLI